MGKPQYTQKYRTSWEKLPELKDWLCAVTTDATKAYCKFCKTTLVCRLADLKEHATRVKHKKAAEPFSSQRQQKLNFQPVNEITKTKIAECELALYCAVHTSMLSVNHLSETCNKIFEDSEATPIRIHRTKCTAIINQCLGPHFKEQLIQDVGDGNFSLILDESTDITVLKMLAVVIRYYSLNHNTIVSTYLGLINLENGTANVIVEAVVNLLKELNLNINNLSGIGTDNASVMVGVNEGVYQKLKSLYGLNNLVLVRCVCHSLQLAVSSATEETIPRHVDYMIRESYNWFHQSTIRQLTYVNIYKLINDDKSPLKLLQMSQTRWLSIERAVDRILNQYLELKTHFEIVRKKEACYTAETLYTLYCDNKNLVYLKFLYPVLAEVQRVNKSFESAAADPVKLYQDLINLVKSIANRVINNFSSRRDINIFNLTANQIDSYLDPQPYLGFSFEKSCEDNNITGDVKQGLKMRCFSFLVKLLKQLILRLPSNLEIFQNISLFSVGECFKTPKNSIINVAKQYYQNWAIVTRIEHQWENLSLVKWQNTNNTIAFWSEVFLYRDASGENPFNELTHLAIKMLVLPHSNADVERVFSQMNLIKSKLRNRMNLNTLNNILYIRFGLKRNNTCCENYDIPTKVLKGIGKLSMYTTKTTTDSSCDSNIVEQETELLHILDNCNPDIDL